MRKLITGRGGGEKVGMLAFEVASLMSRAASLWRALGDDQVARLRGDGVRLEGARRLVADDDAALLALALAEMAGACGDLSRAVARLSARCADPLLRRFPALFAGLLAAGADPHGLRYAAAKKMDRKARKMQRLVAATGLLCQELDVLAELEQAARLRRAEFAPGEAARRVARQRQEVDRLRAASLCNRSLDYAVRLLGRSLFTIVARIIHVFGLHPKNLATDDDYPAASLGARHSFSWSSSFAGTTNSLVYPSDFASATTLQRSTSAAKSGKGGSLLSRSQSLKWQVPGKRLISCVVGGSKSPTMDGWVHFDDQDLPLSFSDVSLSSNAGDDFSSVSCHDFPDSDDHHHHHPSAKLTTSVFESSSHDVLASAPETTLGAAALASHYANLVVFAEKLAISPRHICADERDALYGMLTDRLRASLRARLWRPPAAAGKKKSAPCDRVVAAEWADTVQGILGWLAPVAHNTVRWRSERSFEQRNVGSGTSVLLMQTLHFADRNKTEAAIVDLLVGLNYLWRYGTELSAKAKLKSAGDDVYHDCADYRG
ncbi:hypothetical protein QYE76_003150 [Lolium multiflorum]|uniref:Uncharacterized protein n=1 Tax=Lolium multiflorum TaxID=4521 RepID=A0AAD8RNU0_LOLMU|nr:hypothetical protein QYE76_003150 [Lolium multiflorum]